MLAALCMLTSTAHASVLVDIVAANGTPLRQFAVGDHDSASRSYLEAERGQRYRIRLRNTTAERIGVVVAVDGRNIISGARSELTANEPMYVLGPWESADYSGWRTDLESVNEFYFTDWADSYSEAFGDRSARGVIAVAAYREQRVVLQELRDRRSRAADEVGQSVERSARAAPSASADAATGAAESEPGTGYGDRRVEGAVRVKFRAAPHEAARVLIKYEWRETLCRRGILDCEPANRLWKDSQLGFAPAPPRR